MKKILQNIFSIKNDKRYHKVITILGMKIKTYCYNKHLQSIQKDFEDKLNCIYMRIHRIMPQPRINAFEVHLVEHCNLNCKGCGHFSNIAEPEFLDIDSFTKDMLRMHELTGGDVSYIELLGGEPLLHPSVSDFCIIARNIFKNTNIRLVTNGTLLKAKNETFYEILRDYNITLCITKYPLNIDWTSIEEICSQIGVALEFYQGTGEHEKVMFKQCLDLKGQQDQRANFLICRSDDDYHYLDHGKLYSCWKPAYIKHFNKKFNKNIKVTEQDYIDIYKAKDFSEISEFLTKATPFCKYCDLTKTEFYKWEKSKQDINEWVDSSQTLVAVERERERE